MNTLYCKNPFKKNEQPLPKSPPTVKIHMLPPDSLFPNPSQPRFVFEDEPMLRLADSIKRSGILQPLSVRPAEKKADECQTYQIIAGERRWRAARIIGLKEIPCVVLNVDSQKSAELALIENIQREDLNIFEQAAAISSLIDIYGLTQEQAAKQLSSSQSYIANKLRILRLSPKERTEIIKHNLSERHARALLKITEPELRLEVIQTIAAKEMNVSATEKYIDRLLTPQAPPPPEIKGRIRDLRFFYNSIDNAINILKSCGIEVVSEKNELFGETCIQIRILHN